MWRRIRFRVHNNTSRRESVTANEGVGNLAWVIRCESLSSRLTVNDCKDLSSIDGQEALSSQKISSRLDCLILMCVIVIKGLQLYVLI